VRPVDAASLDLPAVFGERQSCHPAQVRERFTVIRVVVADPRWKDHREGGIGHVDGIVGSFGNGRSAAPVFTNDA
jgi:hypothetical protein